MPGIAKRMLLESAQKASPSLKATREAASFEATAALASLSSASLRENSMTSGRSQPQVAVLRDGGQHHVDQLLQRFVKALDGLTQLPVAARNRFLKGMVV
mmetsp:Transcript_38518/g.69866  ORF Transcript_38518/g.69866 Transcript_38518/m.69866 type:complete len:100 (-) Transcript_38518:904-1203(-)